MFSKFSGVDFKDAELFNNCVQQSLHLMGDSDLTVRVYAALSLKDLIKDKSSMHFLFLGAYFLFSKEEA